MNTVHITAAHTYYIPLVTHCEIMLYSYVHVYECCITLAHHILEVYHVYIPSALICINIHMELNA